MNIVDMVSFSIGGKRADHLKELATEYDLSLKAVDRSPTHLLFVRQVGADGDLWKLLAGGTLKSVFTKVMSLADHMAISDVDCYDDSGRFNDDPYNQDDIDFIKKAKKAIANPMPLMMLPLIAPWITVTRQNVSYLKEHCLPYSLDVEPNGINFMIGVEEVKGLLALWLFCDDISMSTKPVTNESFKNHMDKWKKGDVGFSCNFNDIEPSFYEPADIEF